MPAPSLDAYQWYARTIPAVLVLLPILVLTVMLIGTPFNVAGLILLLSSLGVLFLLSSVVRTRGLKQQVLLFKKWGGNPAAMLLRHDNAAIDPVTKARYHKILENRLGIAMPDPHAESHANEQAQNIYDSCIRWLISQTKDSKSFPEVQREVLQYGFHRNAYGIRGVAILIAIVCLLLAVAHNFSWFFHVTKPIPLFDALALLSPLAALAFWGFYVTEKTVWTYSNEYGRNLLSTIDRI